MPRIRAPYEYNDGPVGNQYRPAQINSDAATSVAREGERAFRTVGEIVDRAAEAAHRNNASADATQLEIELARIRREVESEPAPEDGSVSPEEWYRGIPTRFAERATLARRNIAQARGWRASNVYQNFFNPEADNVLARHSMAAEESAQQRVIDWGRGSVIERAALERSLAMNPDERDPTARERAAVNVRDIYEQAARDGLLSRAEAEEQIASFNESYAEFNRGASEVEEALSRTAEIRSGGGTLADQLAAAEEIEDLSLRARVRNNLIQTRQQDQVAFDATTEEYERMANSAVERNPANWAASLAPEVRAHLEAAGVMGSLRADAENILANAEAGAGGGTGRARLSDRSYVVSSWLERLMSETASDPDLRRALLSTDFSAPLSDDQAEAINAVLGDEVFQSGQVIARLMTVDDWANVRRSLDQMRDGSYDSSRESGPTTMIGAEVDAIVRMAAEENAMSFEGAPNRLNRRRFEVFANRAVRDLWGTGQDGQPLYRTLTPEERRAIIRSALQRAAGVIPFTRSAPAYERVNISEPVE